jgi:hypothetical protein
MKILHLGTFKFQTLVMLLDPPPRIQEEQDYK